MPPRKPATLLRKHRIGENVELIELARIRPTADNPRRIDPDGPELAELVASIKRLGVLVPCLGRPDPQDESLVDLRCGHRRFAATQKAGLTHLPCIVRQMDDREAMELTVLDELQHQQLGPIEQAFAIDGLRRVGLSYQEIGDHFDRPATWAARRHRLMHLLDKIVKAAADPESTWSRLTPTMLELVARLPETAQQRFYEDVDADPYIVEERAANAKALQQLLQAEYMHDLKAANWALEDAALVPEAGACSACPKRSDASGQIELFADLAAKASICLDLACWQTKAQAAVQTKKSELEAQGQNVVLTTTMSGKPPKGTVADFTRIKCARNSKGAAATLAVDGPQAGTLTWTKPCYHSDDSSTLIKRAAGKRPGEPVTSLAERKKQLARRRQAKAINAVSAKLQELIELPTNQAEPITALPLTGPVVTRLLYVFGTDSNGTRKNDWNRNRPLWQTFHDLAVMADKDLWRLNHMLLGESLKVIQSRLQYRGLETVEETAQEAEEACELFAWDWQAMLAEAAKELPEPKSWQNLNKPGKVAKKKAKPARSPTVASTTDGRKKLPNKAPGKGR